jgi:hypothetical protein
MMAENTVSVFAGPSTTASVSATPIVNVGMSSGLSWLTSLCRSEPAWMMQMRSNVPQGIDSVVSAATEAVAEEVDRRLVDLGRNFHGP